MCMKHSDKSKNRIKAFTPKRRLVAEGFCIEKSCATGPQWVRNHFFFRNLKYLFHCPLAANISLRKPVLFWFDLIWVLLKLYVNFDFSSVFSTVFILYCIYCPQSWDSVLLFPQNNDPPTSVLVRWVVTQLHSLGKAPESLTSS